MGSRPHDVTRCPQPDDGLCSIQAPVAQLDRALPSEGKGHTFESCRVRQLTFSIFGGYRASAELRFSDAAAQDCDFEGVHQAG